MPEKKEGPMQDMIDRGNLSLQVTSTIGLLPVENARISISYTGEDSVVEEITTDRSRFSACTAAGMESGCRADKPPLCRTESADHSTRLSAGNDRRQ